jgi:hypothetical protein
MTLARRRAAAGSRVLSLHGDGKTPLKIRGLGRGVGARRRFFAPIVAGRADLHHFRARRAASSCFAGPLRWLARALLDSLGFAASFRTIPR